ncbi:MAG: ATP-binding cassette domain-containing protein [Eubacteriales bacterium]|nr:ATP-binding cassette domain-containing protein [Eubacteriales bacterium]
MWRKKIHIYIAPQRSERGSACLAMLAEYYGRYISLIDAAKLCAVTKDGCGMEQIRRGALSLGFRPEMRGADLSSLKEGNRPCIVTVNREFAVLERLSDKKAVLCSPDRGRISMEPGAFLSVCGGEALFLIPPEGEFEADRRSMSPFRYALSVIGRAETKHVVNYCFHLISISALMLILPSFTSAFTNAFYASGRGAEILSIEGIFASLIIFIVTLFAVEISNVNAFASYSASVSTRCRMDFVWSSLNLPMDFYSVRSDGYFMESAYQALCAGYFLSKQVVEMLIRPVMALFCLIVVARISVPCCAAVLVSVFFLCVLTVYFAGYEDDRGKIVWTESGQAGGFLLDGLKAIRSIRNSGSEFVFFREYVRLNRRSAKSMRRYNIVGGIFEGMPLMTGNITRIILLLLGTYFIYRGKLSMGSLIFIHGLYCITQSYIADAIFSGKNILSIRNSLENLEGIYREAQDAENAGVSCLDPIPRKPGSEKTAQQGVRPEEAAPQGLRPEEPEKGAGTESPEKGAGSENPEKAVLSESPEKGAGTEMPGEDAGTGETKELRKLRGHVEIRNVSFGYNRYGSATLHDISMDIPVGSSVAIVGASGSGKTTLKKLICGRHRPWEGVILYDGIPAEKIPVEVLANSIASVDQQIILFADKVMNNIRMWDETQLDADVILAARDAEIHDQIILREGAYDYIMDDNGEDFSGGERQRIEIARALSMDPSILVLDEATSALDTIVENRIVKNIRNRGITTIVVAHRLSTIRGCDRIYVMDSGRIVDSGTHEELMRTCPLYRTLVTVE